MKRQAKTGVKPWNSGYYNKAFESETLAQIAMDNAVKLEKSLKGALPILCYSGMSGTAYATALALFMTVPHGMMYVRKKGEKCHSYHQADYLIPRLAEGKKAVLVFVDDFVSAGTTRNYTLRRAKLALNDACDGGIPIEARYHFEVVGCKDSKHRSIVRKVKAAA